MRGLGETAAVPPSAPGLAEERGLGAEVAQQRPPRGQGPPQASRAADSLLRPELLLLVGRPARRGKPLRRLRQLCLAPPPSYQQEVNRFPIVPREWWA